MITPHPIPNKYTKLTEVHRGSMATRLPKKFAAVNAALATHGSPSKEEGA